MWTIDYFMFVLVYLLLIMQFRSGIYFSNKVVSSEVTFTYIKDMKKYLCVV
jgi:hypothetical protein